MAAVTALCLLAAWRARDPTPLLSVPLSVLTALFALLLWGPRTPEAIARLDQAHRAIAADAAVRLNALELDRASSGTVHQWKFERASQLAGVHAVATELAAGNTRRFRRQLAALGAVAAQFKVDGRKLELYRTTEEASRKFWHPRLEGEPLSRQPLGDLVDRRNMLMRAAAASDQREPDVLGALFPLEYLPPILAYGRPMAVQARAERAFTGVWGSLR